MASVNEVNLGGSSAMNYYDPKEDSPRVSIIPKQLYPMHITKVDIREVSVKGKYKAKVYNLVGTIAKECAEFNYDSPTGQINGSSFVGRELRVNGIFMFLNPSPGDDFEANNGANEKYLRFCENIGIPCKEVSIDIEGESRSVKQFPLLEKSDIMGKPISGYVDTEQYTDKSGQRKTSYKVKNFDKWADGKAIDVELADLPF